ncbi:sugar phosphate isomerase/epimerase family protein [Lignipirellula cremea]|uniref:Xylose isomerase-like TIM barrel n=1 Tax=Lignipirellula cremea TaxID=2528010 RepID=A0A518DV24_9BACT|nr:sugar phosphate isomerase/epimerase family protein [Lignipirellula cremea]QDU95691.1 Xylose isomerase-like TIM barrel [Lignipirellula cremea]
MSSSNRREFLQLSAGLAAGAAALSLAPRAVQAAEAKPLFKLSLAEWSLHKSIRAGKVDPLDFAKITKQEFGIDAVEYVNQFFADKAQDMAYLKEMKTRAADQGVSSQIIMIDREGKLGDPNEAERTKSVENHYKWVEAAKFLGCHAIRVNAASAGEYDEQLKLAADGLRRLSEFAARHDMSVIVENHGGLSSNGKWLAAVIEKVDLKNCGTLPDFGNFGDYDRYQGVTELMPYAKAVSAKSHDFDAAGNETKTDYLKMMKIVLDAGYHGYVGIEYEGSKIDEFAGILATKKLLDRVRDELAG